MLTYSLSPLLAFPHLATLPLAYPRTTDVAKTLLPHIFAELIHFKIILPKTQLIYNILPKTSKKSLLLQSKYITLPTRIPSSLFYGPNLHFQFSPNSLCANHLWFLWLHAPLLLFFASAVFSVSFFYPLSSACPNHINFIKLILNTILS